MISLLSTNETGDTAIMATLIVRNLDETIVHKLKQRAARNARSAEAEHRAILEAALIATRRKSLVALLARMPNVGDDADFARTHQGRPPFDVFD